MPEKSEKRLKSQHGASTKGKQSRAGQAKVEGSPMEHSGVVRGFRTNRHRGTDGLILEDRTVVRFPAHVAKKIENKVQPGDQILAIGTHHETSKGNWQLRASYLECLRSEFTIDIEDDPKADQPQPIPVDPPTASTKVCCSEILEEIKMIITLLQDHISPGASENSTANTLLLTALRKLRVTLESE